MLYRFLICVNQFERWKYTILFDAYTRRRGLFLIVKFYKYNIEKFIDIAE